MTVRGQRFDDWPLIVESRTGVSARDLGLLTRHDYPAAAVSSAVDLYALKDVGETVAVATDFDDTCVASGGWRIKGTGAYLGGVDSTYPRGTSYPGFGGLLYLLSQGRHTSGTGSSSSTSRRKRPPLLPLLPVVLASARPSLPILFRPRSLYRHIAASFTQEAFLLGADKPKGIPRVKYENKMNLLYAVLTGGSYLYL